MAGNAGGLDLVFEQRLGFFHHHQMLHACSERADSFQRRRAGQAELEHRRVGESFAHVHEGQAGGDETHDRVAAIDQRIEHAAFGFGGQRCFALEHQRQTRLGVAGHHHPAARILGKAGRLHRDALADFDTALDVADARGQAQDHRTTVALGQFEGLAGHRIGFLRVGGLEHRQVGKRPQ